MLSYQHMYHSGNIADVHKHYCLSIIIGHLTKQTQGIDYIDSHAGAGLYNLGDEYANKTMESKHGLLRLLKNNNIPKDSLYFETIGKIQKEFGNWAYFGSPLLAKSLLRPTDSLLLMELHPQEYKSLKQLMLPYKNVQIFYEDGYTKALKVPISNNRKKIILIDPSYEIKDEYKWVVKFIEMFYKKHPDAIIILWYPILQNNLYAQMLESLLGNNYSGCYSHEIDISSNPYKKNNHVGMLKSGLFFINMPAACKDIVDQINFIK